MSLKLGEGTKINSQFVIANSGNTYGTNYSYLGVGGFYELANITERNSIPIDSLNLMNSDGSSSGRRRLGMIVHTTQDDKYWQLLPQLKISYQFGPSTIVVSATTQRVTQAIWNTLTDAEKLVLLDPTASVFDSSTNRFYFGSGDASTAWYDTPLQVYITGGTYNSGTTTLSLFDTSGNTIIVTGFTTGGGGGGGVTSVNTGTGLSGNTTTGNITLVNTAPDQIVTITGGTNIQITGSYPNFGVNFTGTTGGGDVKVTSFTYSNNVFTIKDNSGGTFTATIDSMTGLTVNGNLSATTFFGNGSGLTNVVKSITTGTGLSGNTTTGNITLVNTAPDQVVTITGGTNIQIAGTYPNFGVNLTGSTGISVSANTGLGLSANTLYTIYNTTISGSTTMPEDVGGLPAGTTAAQLTGLTLVQLFDEILFPTVQPTYTIPTITLQGVTTQTLEVGSTFNTNINLFGIKNDANAFTQLRIFRDAGVLSGYTSLSTSSETNVPDQFGYTNPNNPNLRYTINPTPYAESYVIPAPGVGNSSTTTYYGDGNYGSGLAKLDSKGQTDIRPAAVRSVNAPQLGDTGFQSSTYTITGIYPYFWGTSGTLPTASSIANAISAGTANKVVASAAGTISIPYNTFGQFIWVAYYAGYTTKTKWYRTDLDTGNIDGSFISTATTQSVDSPDSYWSGISYKMHWSVYATIQNNFEYRNS